MTPDSVPIVGGKYALVTKLGHGSMADVYLGLSEGLEGFAKLSVVKLLRSHLAEDRDFVARFLEEGRIAMRLSHPNVVQTYEVGREAASYYLAMEYLEGQTLSAVLNRASRRSDEFDFACQIVVLTEVLSALEYAHELADYDGTPLDVVHRDVSPPNVFVTYDGTVKVLDFGIARALDTSVETKTGIILGKAAYMAPEQALGRDIDRRADLYAVGVMLWEAVAGQRRWQGMQDAAIIRELVTSDLVELPRELVPGCPTAVHEILARALAPDPADRYANAAEFRNDLELLLSKIGCHIAARHLGPRVASAFRADRERVAREIERAIGRRTPARKRALNAPAELDAAADLPKLQAEPDGARRNSVQPITTGAYRASRVEARRQSVLTGGAIALALIAAWSAGWLASERSSPVTESARASPEPARVELRLAAHPPAAVLYLDDRRLSGNPASIERDADGSAHVFRAEAPGHAPAHRVLRLTGNVDVTLRLEPLPAGSDAVPPSAPVRERARVSPSATRRAQPSPSGLPVGTASFANPAPDAGTPKVNLDLGNPW